MQLLTVRRLIIFVLVVVLHSVLGIHENPPRAPPRVCLLMRLPRECSRYQYNQFLVPTFWAPHYRVL